MQAIETTRLYIQEATLEDSPFILNLVNSPNWLEFIGDKNIRALEAAADYIQRSLINSYRENGFGLYKMVLKEKNTAIGICGFVKRSYLEHPDIGFAILPSYERKGYTFEAATAVLNYGKEMLNLSEILAITSLENKASQTLLSKIGLTKIDTIQPEGSTESLLLYSNSNNNL
ncbi:MAG: GNAT family N-acetyltransferase [Aureispira sp.]|nr:GNAT family N-acetyltransferase [Aureispira sp.]